MKIAGHIASNESVRGRKKQTYEEVMRRKVINEEICYINPGGFNNDPLGKFNTIDKLLLVLRNDVMQELDKFLKESKHNWFDIIYSWLHSYDDTSIIITANRHETDDEYKKRTTAWLKRQKKKL